MRFFWTLFWTFLLVQMASYVVASMIGAAYEFGTASIIAVVSFVLITALGEIIPLEPIEKH
ncbi:YjzD family protein [Bacillus luteolus]|uniref:YjzD family protein n=1 Tax=Litchfieldia luteola TaxID=682179 RepID=A0ABR9QLH8_9BACI|nr:YjzD family protein [Cytobacillus luteolus]MBE4909350.1 YjzD family protein [Cytobacillus luteolus]MBP1940746.1 hypothetical protein [Cytobacillus luteolus]